MNIKQISVCAAMILYGTAAFSGEDQHSKIEIKVVSDDNHGNTRLVLDSDEMNFDLHDMQVGENQSVVDKEGRPVLITRNEDGFEFQVDGKTIDMPDFTQESDVDVHVMRRHVGNAPAPHAMTGMEGVMIISGAEIDDATQQIIRTALESAGHDSVHFADGHGGAPHQVKVVSKVIEVSD